jgi:hypothetical protein
VYRNDQDVPWILFEGTMFPLTRKNALAIRNEITRRTMDPNARKRSILPNLEPNPEIIPEFIR